MLRVYVLGGICKYENLSTVNVRNSEQMQNTIVSGMLIIVAKFMGISMLFAEQLD